MKKIETVYRKLNHREIEHIEEYYYQIKNFDRDKKSKLVDYKKEPRTVYLNKAVLMDCIE